MSLPSLANLPLPRQLDPAILENARRPLWQQGWAVLPDFLPEPLLDVLDREAGRLTALTPAGVGRTYATDPDGGVLVMNGLDARSELLFELARSTPLISAARALLSR